MSIAADTHGHRNRPRDLSDAGTCTEIDAETLSDMANCAEREAKTQRRIEA